MKIATFAALGLIWFCSLQQGAVADERSQCKTGLFLKPHFISKEILSKSSDFQAELTSLRSRSDVARQLAPHPYFGPSSGHYIEEGRRDLLAAMNLALSSTLDQGVRAKDESRKAAEILLAWTATATPGQFPSAKPVNRDEYRDYTGLGIDTGWMAIGAAQAYHSLVCKGALADEQANSIRAWLRRLLSYIFEGRQFWERNGYFGGQVANNHLSVHNLAVYTLGVVLDDASLREWAYRSSNNRSNFLRMMRLAIYDGREPAKDIRDKVGSVPVRGEVYDRYRMSDNGKGLHYAIVHLMALSLLAEAATIQGEHAFDVRGNTNVSLADSLLYYGRLFANTPCQLGSVRAVGKDAPNYRYYFGAKINAVYWNWLLPSIAGLNRDARIAKLSDEISRTKCVPAAPEYMPVPIFPVMYALSSFH
jgi:uncharacterized small protein (DUF1192 family)